MTTTSSVVQSLSVNHPYPTVLEASLHRLHEDPDTGPGSWWFRVSIDNGDEANATSELWERTSMSATMSQQYGTYDEAAAALNAFLADFYREQS